MMVTSPVTKPEVGKAVIYTDPMGVDHDAILTAVWSPSYVNLVYVSGDENRQDQYGRQIERESSVTYQGVLGVAKGRFFRMPDEVKIHWPTEEPQQV